MRSISEKKSQRAFLALGQHVVVACAHESPDRCNFHTVVPVDLACRVRRRAGLLPVSNRFLELEL